MCSMYIDAFVRYPQAEWILNADMFKDAMTSANLDVKKMPLGSLSQAQVIKHPKLNFAGRSRMSRARHVVTNAFRP
jgi:hypothetical protein